MNAYQIEQIEALQGVRRYLRQLPAAGLDALREEAAGYLDFRKDVQGFLSAHFGRFIAPGFGSPLMHLHNSPGLLRLKKKAESRVR